MSIGPISFFTEHFRCQVTVTDGYLIWGVEIGGTDQIRKAAKSLGVHDRLFAILVKHGPKSTVEILRDVDHAGVMDHYKIEHGQFSSSPFVPTEHGRQRNDVSEQ